MTTTYVMKHLFNQGGILLSVNSVAWPISKFKF